LPKRSLSNNSASYRAFLAGYDIVKNDVPVEKRSYATALFLGYRFLADEWLPEGLHPEETKVLAGQLEKRGVVYLCYTFSS
jgi:2,4-dienoyl-CoA reductase-like NADH-dependent reductase (Old Yellow Enzyme family)